MNHPDEIAQLLKQGGGERPTGETVAGSPVVPGPESRAPRDATPIQIEYDFDRSEIENHNSIDIWRFENGRRGHVVASVKCVAPIWLPGGNDMDIEAMNEATVARANLIVGVLTRAIVGEA